MLLQTPLPDFDPSIAEEFGYAVSNTASFLGTPLWEGQGILNLLLRFGFNLLISFIIVHCFYYKKARRRDYYLTLMLFSSAMFLLLFLMENVKLQIGFTLGLFAIFGMIRYRTETVPIREMTYLFIIIALSVINGIGLNVSYGELFLANGLIIALIWIAEKAKFLSHTSTKLVTYDRIELIVPERREELVADLEKRLGVKIIDLEIGSVDFLKDSAFIKVRYQLKSGESNTVDSLRRAKDYVE